MNNYYMYGIENNEYVYGLSFQESCVFTFSIYQRLNDD